MTQRKKLTREEQRVILHKGTELPFTGAFYNYQRKGTYVCKQCGAPLYHSEFKFDSGCGWPSFDEEIPGAVQRIPDADGRRTEIVCANCGAHLGHVFLNEGFTPKQTRHCVNSISMDFVPDAKDNTETAIFAGGCFWGIEHEMRKLPGVISVESGYIGGKTEDPCYEEVCAKTTGHAEAVRIIFDPSKITYETLTRNFFELHDPTQLNRQGPDVGEQYRSEIFYTNDQQKEMAEKLIALLRAKGYNVITRITPALPFWVAEDYHQNYFGRRGRSFHCHNRVKRFD